MIKKIIEVDQLMSQIDSEHKLETANPKGIKNLYKKETLELIKVTPFIKDEAYFYCLTQYGDFIVSTKKTLSYGMFGFGYWEGMGIMEYPLLDKNGFYVFADVASEGDERAFYAYNSQNSSENMVWVTGDLEKQFIPKHENFIAFLRLILNQEI